MTGQHRHASTLARVHGRPPHFARAGLTVTGAAVAFALAACGSSGDAGGAGSAGASGSTAAGGPSISILEPANNANVTEPFTLKVRSSEDLGALDTGKDHFHLSFDGHPQDYTVQTRPQVSIDKLSPGRHTISVSLQHADHSPVGPRAQITVMVQGPGGGSSSDTGGSSGNGY
jgi:hypothetical protein